MLKSHYSPKSRLTLFTSPDEIPADFKGETIYFKRPPSPKKSDFWLTESGDVREAARNLFALLRSLDKVSEHGFYCQRVPNVGVGTAVNDRLSRAESKFDK